MENKALVDPFIQTLYEVAMSSNPAIGFSPDGDTLEIRNGTTLEESLFPKHFPGFNLDKFIQRLGKLGFVQTRALFQKFITDTDDFKIEAAPLAFQHPNFRYNGQDLLLLIHEENLSTDNNSGEKSFIYVLFDMVTENEGSFIGFSDDGKYLEIRDRTNLERELLPKYFKDKTLDSIIEQLNELGFEKLSGKPFLCSFEFVT